MKKVVLFLIAALPASVFAQGGTYTIKGKVGTLSAPASIFLTYGPQGKRHTDSVMLNKGNFSFTGEIKEPIKATLVLKHSAEASGQGNDALSIYLVKGTINIQSADSVSKAMVIGTRLNEDLQEYRAQQAAIQKKYDELETQTGSVPHDQQNSRSFQQQQKVKEKAIDAEYFATNKKFAQTHPSSLVSLTALDAYAYAADYPELKLIFDHLSPDVKSTIAGQQVAIKLAKIKRVAVGAEAPDFTQPDTVGRLVKLSSFRGRYVLVDFWASWCPPCRAENPNVLAAYQKYKDKGFTVLSISLDRPGAKAKWLAAIHQDHLSWTQVSDLKFFKNEAAQLYGIDAIPQNFLINPDGKIIAKTLFGDDLENKLKEMLQ